jgi:hypothetical protein
MGSVRIAARRQDVRSPAEILVSSAKTRLALIETEEKL